MHISIDSASQSESSGFGGLGLALALASVPGIIASLRKDKDQGKIWLYGLLSPVTFFITGFKALIWAVRPSGISIEEYRENSRKAKEAARDLKAKTERVKGGTGALKETVENGDKVTGPVFLKEYFGWGSIRLYKNGFIYIATRMSEPEKLLSISGNTDLAIGQKMKTQLSGAILTVVTEKDVYTVGEGTWSDSNWLTPSTIKELTRLVAAGNALIQK